MSLPLGTKPSGAGRYTIIALLAMLFGGLLTACGDDSDDTRSGGLVRPFSDVQDGELSFELDPTDPSRGIFRVTTTEPMICAIVWGESESFGRLNNSLSMNGTGIVEHDVVLPDVETGVTYSFVVQGTTSDGTLYRSDVGTFRFDPPGATAAEAVAELGDNIAPRATVADVSSEFSAAFAATMAIDDDTSTEWATSGDGDEGWIVLDLGEDETIAGVEFVTRSMADGSGRTTTYTVAVDDDPPQGPFDSATVAERAPVELSTRGRVVRFDVGASTGGNVGAVEIRIYARDA